MNKRSKRGKADLVRKLMRASGLSREGVYKCLRDDRVPKNKIAARRWLAAKNKLLPQKREADALGINPTALATNPATVEPGKA